MPIHAEWDRRGRSSRKGDADLCVCLVCLQRFVNNKPADNHPTRNLERVKATAGGQKPFAAFLSCADSRVPVEIIFDQG